MANHVCSLCPTAPWGPLWGRLRTEAFFKGQEIFLPSSLRLIILQMLLEETSCSCLWILKGHFRTSCQSQRTPPSCLTVGTIGAQRGRFAFLIFVDRCEHRLTDSPQCVWRDERRFINLCVNRTHLVSIFSRGSRRSSRSWQTHGSLNTISSSWALRSFLSLFYWLTQHVSYCQPPTIWDSW